MSIKESLRSDLTEAIRGRDEITSGTIRMVLTAITNEEVAGKEARVLSDDEVITVLSREAKKRREAAEAFESAGRSDRAALEKAEGEVIGRYLPAQLSVDEIKKMIANAIASTGAAGARPPAAHLHPAAATARHRRRGAAGRGLGWPLAQPSLCIWPGEFWNSG